MRRVPPHLLEEPFGADDRLLDAQRPVLAAECHTRSANWASFSCFGIPARAATRAAVHRQALGTIQPVQRGELVTDGAGGPVLRHAAPDEAVERQAAAHIRLRAPGSWRAPASTRGAAVHQHLQQPFRQPVLHPAPTGKVRYCSMM